MNAPGQAHAISIEKHPNRVRVTFNGAVIADTQRALVLKEGRLPPVYYIPREDVRMTHLQRTAHDTHCPFKGDASYCSVCVNDRTADHAAWTYDAPFESVRAIKQYVSFDNGTLDAIEEIPLTPDRP